MRTSQISLRIYAQSTQATHHPSKAYVSTWTRQGTALALGVRKREAPGGKTAPAGAGASVSPTYRACKQQEAVPAHPMLRQFSKKLPWSGPALTEMMQLSVLPCKAPRDIRTNTRQSRLHASQMLPSNCTALL